MRDANIVTPYKNKGDRSDCNNYRGISLLSIVEKLSARIILTRLQQLAERIYRESQCGFCAKRCTVDIIFSLRQLQEKSREQNQPMYTAFIELTKMFDLYLCSTNSNILSLDVEINKRIGKASTTLLKLTKRDLENKHLTTATKMKDYKACVISTLHYGSESWTTHTAQERKLEVFQLCCLSKVLGNTWKDKVTANAAYAGSVKPTEWMVDAYQRTYRTGNLPQEQGVEGGHTPSVLGRLQERPKRI
ncbi:uncharacterized protein LOC128547166 [Mercenaria mercenaria]|uniref:uncharacterized protein LOC128547166 n=1 Tax=Mercenaria mercenaria TaxID=6596 RepID=UPI00234F28E5|nr:uncharacterized protein LOC128547166 [Mercenaria mercenaria]